MSNNNNTLVQVLFFLILRALFNTNIYITPRQITI